MLQEETVFDILNKLFMQISTEIIGLLPKILIAIIMVSLTLVVVKVLNLFLKRLMRVARLEIIVKQFIPLPFSLENVIIFLADLGLGLIAFLSIANLFLEQRYMEIVADALYYGVRVASIVIIAIIIFAIFDLLIGRVKVETRLRSYAMLIVLLLITAMLIDITALSDQVKGALTLGLSIGVGLAVGVFAIWFFFHDYLDKIFKVKSSQKGEDDE
ncbi:MAG: hypothetical protein RMJ07_03280 [Nitrososphaerota archaeon]|nr:hypothetical protein [Candidatus Bathyarchaeota archaeon]MDW8048686.1 hypothetical protein [Nitrososphaerota archaeon]